MAQELEVLLSTVDVECTLDKLKRDRAFYAKQLAELQLQNESQNSLPDQTHISELMEFVELRNKQIKEMEQNIMESNQGIYIDLKKKKKRVFIDKLLYYFEFSENRAKTRWHTISSMADAKEALRTLFDITASKGKDFSLLKSKYSDLEVKKFH